MVDDEQRRGRAVGDGDPVRGQAATGQRAGTVGISLQVPLRADAGDQVDRPARAGADAVERIGRIAADEYKLVDFIER